MPKRRRLRNALAGLGEGISNVGTMLLTDRLNTKKLDKQTEAAQIKEMLDAFNTQTRTILSPEYVAKYGPERVQAEYGQLRRRLPKQAQAYVGDDPDFGALDASVSQRLEPVRNRIATAASPEAIPGLEEISMLMDQNRVSPKFTMPGGGMGFPLGDITGDSPELTRLKEMAEGRKSGMVAERNRTTPRESFTDEATGVTRFLTEEEQGKQGSFKTGLSSGEKVDLAGKTTGAQQQATQDVLNHPLNVKGFVTRVAAAAFARQQASLKADRQAGAGAWAPQPHIIEDRDAAGNKVFRILDMKTGRQTGGDIATNVPSETQTDGMRTAYAFADRAVQAHNRMVALEPKMMEMGYMASRIGLTLDQLNAPEAVSDPVVKQYAQAMRTFINAGLGRPESGAQISVDEWKTYQKTNAFTPGIDAGTLGQVQAARREAVNGLAVRSGDQLGKQFVGPEEIAALMEVRGHSREQVIKDLEDANYRIIR